MIRSSNHHYRKYANIGKLSPMDEYCIAYREAVVYCVEYLWSNKIVWGKNKSVWDLKNNLLNCPQMISTTGIGYKGKLSARSLKCASTQACGIVKAVVDKRVKDLNKKKYLESLNRSPRKALQRRISNPITKPECDTINCELNSICMDVLYETGKHFSGFIQLKSLWSSASGYPRGSVIRIPFKNHKQSNRWKSKGKFLNSILINESCIVLRWEVPTPNKKQTGKTIAIDQGLIDCLTTTDSTQKFTKDKHGHTLQSIIEKMARKRWGSEAFCRAAKHRKNYINFLVRQLTLSDVRELKLEEIVNIKYGRNVNRIMKHWVNPLIRDSLIKVCEEAGVLFTHVPNEFNSQRCTKCGWTHKSNRKGKFFKCTMCGHEDDSDHNASCNVLVRDTLFTLPFGFRSLRLNLKGFYWTQSGLSDRFGQELKFTVPVVPNIEQINHVCTI